MSEKKRQKKDGERKDRENKEMRSNVSSRQRQPSSPRRGKTASSVDKPGEGATDNTRRNR